MSDELEVEANDYMEWVNGLRPHEHELVLVRALNALGWDYQITPDGVGWEGDEREPKLQRALHTQYTLLFAKETMAFLVQEGEIEPVCVHKDGQIGYAKVEA